MRKLSLFLFIMLLALPLAMFNNEQKLFVVAATISISFDNTTVLNDLSSSTLDNIPFDINDYTYDPNSTLRVINFVEFGYSYYSALLYNYGLYVYIYNPQALDIDVNSLSNKIQMASLYSAGGVPEDYTKYNLKLCSQYEKLFYKFKIEFTDEQRQAVLDRIKNNRRYDISSIELFTTGDTNAVDYTIALTVKVSGYAAKFGQNAVDESTLQISITSLGTIPLNLYHTYYDYPLDVDKENNLRLNTVYFSVPNDFYEYYGSLQRIKAEWYEYKLNPVLVTSSSTIRDNITPYLGQHITAFNEDIGRALVDGNFYNNPLYNTIFAEWAFNPFDNRGGLLNSGVLINPDKVIDAFYLMFFTSTNIGEYIVPRQQLLNTILEYNFNSNNGTLPIKGGTISADLFQSNVDMNRQRGHNVKDFEYGVDPINLDGFNYSFWEDFLNNGLLGSLWNISHGNNNALQLESFMPIKTLKDSDFHGSLDEQSNRLGVNKSGK
jgi:hypothetical protein